MSKKRKFFPTVHSIERAREYFGVNELRAVDFVNDLAEKAVHLMIQPDTKRRITYNEEHDVKLVLGPNDNTVITILPPGKQKQPEVSPPKAVTVTNYIIEKARTTIQREIAKTKRQFTREFRTLAERQALVQIEIAQLTLNKARAKNPNTQARIQANIDVALGLFDEIGSAISELQAEFERTKREAQAFLTV